MPSEQPSAARLASRVAVLCALGAARVSATGQEFCFLSHGSWGRQVPATQDSVAALMDDLAGIHKPRFVLSTGDNVYPKGVSSVTDPKFQTVFEKPYDLPHIGKVPFIVGLGDHDYEGDIWAQVKYTNHSSRTPPTPTHPKGEPRWYMPHPYFERHYPEASLMVLMVDTELVEICKLNGNSSPKCWDGGKQTAWIDERLAAAKSSGVKWIVVSGHYPLHANGHYRNWGNGRKVVVEHPMWRHGATMYVNSHNHYQQASLVTAAMAPKGIRSVATGKAPILFVNSGVGSGAVANVAAFKSSPNYKVSPHNVFTSFDMGLALHCIKGAGAPGATMTTQFFSVKRGAVNPQFKQVQKLPGAFVPPQTLAPVTAAPVTAAPVTVAPLTAAPATAAPVTVAPLTAAPATAAPVTAAPVTAAPATEVPATEVPVTPTPDTQAPVTAAPLTKPPATDAPTTQATDFCFLSHGCWGRQDPAMQDRVAALMDELAGIHKPHFVVAAGDNIYPKGAKSVHDPVFQTIFEKPYGLPHIGKVPFIVGLGNHDYYGGNIWPEIRYTNHSSRTPPTPAHPKGEPRWYMPHPYFERHYPEASLMILTVDTELIERCAQKGANSAECWDGGRQHKWIDGRLAAAKAKGVQWMVVTGHYPLHSNGHYDNNGWGYSRKWSIERAMWRHGAAMYINAHNHYQQAALVTAAEAPSPLRTVAAGKQPILFVNSGGGTRAVPNIASYTASFKWKVSPHAVFTGFDMGPALHCIKGAGAAGATMTTQFFSVNYGAKKPRFTQVQTR